MAQKTLLELTTQEAERAIIKIDNAAYELRCREDLGLKEDTEFTAMYNEFEDASKAKDWRLMAAILDRMVQGVVIGMPADVLAKLNDIKKLKIVQAFTKEVGASHPQTSKEPAMAA